jgi:hypothetical protein
MADISIGALKNRIANNGGLQRSNRFLVTIKNSNYFPIGESIGSEGTPNSYIAESILLPTITMTTQADALAGPGLGRTVARGLAYRDGVLITFPVFGNLELLENVNDWMKSIYQQNNGAIKVWMSEFYTNYAENSSIKVDILDLNGTITGTYTFQETYPVEIAPIQLSATSNNEYLKIIVRFAFREYNFKLATN